MKTKLKKWLKEFNEFLNREFEIEFSFKVNQLKNEK